ncbi:GTPase [Occultella kanbiaonis]|uniref:GTPase n=1 Tax=Occultella kanbiaonis TaxID=2675754 RepID=UPI0012B99552|nr:GTPase [Occultella kanbiaonis]
MSTAAETGAELSRRIAEIGAALELAGDRIDADVVGRARADLAAVTQRVELGVDYTVVALVGGTGSGKSSLFNALTRLEFADVGVLRPTTARAAACVWGSDATALLDFLQVDPKRRIQRVSELDAGTGEEALNGLVLLDLPDHDSVEEDHALQVNRLLPLIDLLVWVVDPQKYADNALHEKYLRALAARHEAMIVVINQIDTIPERSRDPVRDDVRRLIDEDGLGDVRIRMVSARAGDGVEALHGELGEVIAGESISARTARSEIDAITERLRPHLGDGEPQPPYEEATAERIAVAAGVPSVTESIRSAVSSPRRVALSPVQQPARSRIEAIRDRWIAEATKGLPPLWLESVTATVPDGAEFDAHVWKVLSAEELPSAQDGAAARRRILGVLATVLGAALVIGALVILVLHTPVPAAALAAGGVVVLIGGILLLSAAKRQRQATAVARSEDYLTRTTSAIADVVRRDLREPTAGALADHAAVRRGIRGA